MTSSSSSPSAQPRTYYTLLGIDQDANPKEIEKAYKRQVREA
jgi:DnaJ-class molecular chaperone